MYDFLVALNDARSGTFDECWCPDETRSGLDILLAPHNATTINAIMNARKFYTERLRADLPRDDARIVRRLEAFARVGRAIDEHNAQMSRRTVIVVGGKAGRFWDGV